MAEQYVLDVHAVHSELDLVVDAAEVVFAKDELTARRAIINRYMARNWHVESITPHDAEDLEQWQSLL